MSVWGKVTGKRKQFLSLVCDGTPTYDACRKVWPKLKDVHGHVMSLFDDPEFREVHAKLTEHQTNREFLLSDCRRIIDDDRSKGSDRLRAIHTAGMIRGFIQSGIMRQPQKRRAVIEDSQILEKMVELGRKANKVEGKANGHARNNPEI